MGAWLHGSPHENDIDLKVVLIMFTEGGAKGGPGVKKAKRTKQY